MNEEQVDPGRLSFNGPLQSIRFEQVGFSYDSNDRKVLQELALKFLPGRK